MRIVRWIVIVAVLLMIGVTQAQTFTYTDKDGTKTYFGPPFFIDDGQCTDTNVDLSAGFSTLKEAVYIRERSIDDLGGGCTTPRWCKFSSIKLLNPFFYSNDDVAQVDIASNPAKQTVCGNTLFDDGGAFFVVYGTRNTTNRGKNLGNGRGTPMVGDPVNAATGNKFVQQDDFVGDKWLTFSRYYNSDFSAAPTSLGPHWSHTFARYLSINTIIPGEGVSTSSVVTAFRADGKQETFQRNNSVWVSDADVADQLTEQDDTQGNPVSYTLFVADDKQYERYSTDGLLQSVTDGTGEGVSLTYGADPADLGIAPTVGRLLSVSDAKGRQLTFAYDTEGHLHTVTLPDGSVLTYGHDANTGDLTSVAYPDGKGLRYVYNEPSLTSGAQLSHVLTGIIDEAGVRYATTGYDQSGRAISTSFAGNVWATSILYNSDGTSTIRYPLGFSSTMTFVKDVDVLKMQTVDASCGTQCGQPWKYVSYSGDGYSAVYTDFNWHYAQSLGYQDGSLTFEEDAPSTPLERAVVTLDWDHVLHVPLFVIYSNDAKNDVFKGVKWAYNRLGEPLARCEIDMHAMPAQEAESYACTPMSSLPAGVHRWTYTYCDVADDKKCPWLGLMLTATGPRTDLAQTIAYSYYTSSSAVNCGTPGAACHRPGDLHSVTDALGHVTTVASYDGAGRITRMIDANGVNTDFTYTARGWVASLSVRGAITRVTYMPYGTVQTITDADGVTTSYGYDAAHRLVKITDALGNSIQYTLDAVGNKTAEQVFDANGKLRKSLRRTFNTLGQLTKVVDGLNHTVFDASADGSYDVNGNLVQSSDGLGIKRQLSYDALNRLVQTVDNYNGVDTATKNTTTKYAYDTLDHVTQITDPTNLVTTYNYDDFGNVVGQVSPDTGTVQRTFDAAGNVLTRTDAKGITATYTYDALNRLLTVKYADASQDIAYYYDEPNRATGCSNSYPVGRLTRIVENNVSTTYCYDAHGHVVEKRQRMGTTTDTTGYSYTAAGRLSGIVYPSGTLVSYTRDGDGRIQIVNVTPNTATANTVVVSKVTYEPFGPVSGYTLGNGQQVVRTFDANYRLTDLMSLAFNLHVARDAMGNIIAIGNAVGASPATETYKYDPLYRLTTVREANGSVLESVTYNQAGDRLSKTGAGLATGMYGYKSNTHQLIAVGNASRRLDANGNTTAISQAGSTYGFGYNDRNRLIVAQLAANTVGSYTYNANEERVAKTTSGSTERYDYDEASQILGEYGATNRDYIWMDGIPVANIDTLGVKGAIAYVIADELGTPRAVVNSGGTTEWKLPYQGNSWNEQSPASSGYTYNLRFLGQYYDAETGLSHNGYRSFGMSTGRYLQADPLGNFGGQSSLYAYVNNNPLVFVDPYGLWIWGDPLPQGVVDFAAGLGDGVSFGMTSMIRDAMGTNGVVNRCSKIYDWSRLAGTALPVSGGIGRLAYAEAAAALPEIAAAASEDVTEQALNAGSLRNGLKAMFRGDFNGSSTWRMYDPAELLQDRYGGDAAEMLQAAGRTSPYFNALGLTSILGGTANSVNSQCGCRK